MNPSRARVRMATRTRGRHSDDGITLVEVMLAFIILMITMVPMGYLLTTTVQASTTARQRQAALQLADSWMEILSNTSVPTYPTGNPNAGLPVTDTWLTSQSTPALTDPVNAQNPNAGITPVSTLAGTQYSVEAYYSFQSVNNPNGQSDLCTGGQVGFTNPITIELQVKVTWDGGRQSLLDSTNFQQPLQAPTYGYLAIQLGNSGLADANGLDAMDAMARLQAPQVTITDLTTNQVVGTPTPDQNGCVFVAEPTSPTTNLSDPFSVSVSQPATGTLSGYTGTPPFVTTSIPAATTDTSATYYPDGVTVTAGAKTVVDLDNFDQGVNDYDEAMTTSLSYGGASAVDGGVECPGTTKLTCLTTGNGPSAATAAWGGGGSSWSSTTLSGVTNLSQVACTSATDPTCVGVGDGPGGAVILATNPDLESTSPDQVPTGPSGQEITDLTQVICPSTDGCYALGSLANGTPVLLAGAVGPGTWQVVAAPASTTFNQLSSIACPTSTTCELTGSATVGTVQPTGGDLPSRRRPVHTHAHVHHRQPAHPEQQPSRDIGGNDHLPDFDRMPGHRYRRLEQSDRTEHPCRHQYRTQSNAPRNPDRQHVGERTDVPGRSGIDHRHLLHVDHLRSHRNFRGQRCGMDRRSHPITGCLGTGLYTPWIHISGYGGGVRPTCQWGDR